MLVRAFVGMSSLYLLSGCFIADAYGLRGTSPASSSAASPATATAPAETVAADSPPPVAAPKPVVDLTPPTGLPDLRPLLGDDAAWAPAVFAGIHAGMVPADAEKVIAGAGKVDKYGFSEVRVKGVAGVDSYRFYFQDGKIDTATIRFKRSMRGDDFYAYLVKVAANKYGETKPEQVTKKLITWMDSSYRSAQLIWAGDHFDLEVGMEKD